MSEFINIYAGALVALSSLRGQAGVSRKIPHQTETGSRSIGTAGDSAPATARAARRPEAAPILQP
ncbi:hypothetical protein [Ferrovibrio xuzhouensis]|uniref:Uncharacterized protein n=1 Tax=Ferrovibrio xuzhouensis TaxID=1576914 RepID=A0ABV7VD98_9PROT